jgi:hypothetical protein
MHAKVNPSTISAVLISMATASLVTMLSLNHISHIIHADLYNYGLRFSYRWAMPYWVFSGIIFGFCWTNIAISMIITFYVYRKNRKVALISKNEDVIQLKQANEQRKLDECAASSREPQLFEKESDAGATREFAEEGVKSPEMMTSNIADQKSHGAA